jgi:multiple sugar transport system permease protein
LQVALILRTILALQVFAVVLAIAGRETLTVLAYETYRAYDSGESGLGNPNLAASYAAFVMLLSLVISFVYLRTVRAQEEAASA